MVILDSKNGNRPVLTSSGGQYTRFPEVLEWGTRLAETPLGVATGSHKNLWEARGWKEFVSHMPENKRAITAIMLENVRQQFGRMDEVTRTSSIGTFDKWIFPVVANMSENDVIDQLVALQPMAGPVSQIVYLDIVTSRRKGRIPAGAPAWRALAGASDRDNDGDEYIQDEAGTLATNAGQLEWYPIRNGTLEITVGSDTTVDDGNGNVVASGAITGGTVNYATGAFTITGVSATADYTISYAYNSEGNANNQGMELKMSSTPVTAKVLKLKAVWSEEADQNLQAMYNIKADGILMTALTNQLQYQKHRQVIFDLRAKADAGFVTWDATAPANVGYQQHKFSINDAFVTGSNMIFGATNMATGNWLLVGLQAATVVQTLPMFTAKGDSTKRQGVTYIGDIAGMKVFVDPHYPVNEVLIGHKGDAFLSTGYVLAEYQKLYTTPDITLPDFLHQRGFATSFARKCINPKMYARMAVLNSPTNFGSVIG